MLKQHVVFLSRCIDHYHGPRQRDAHNLGALHKGKSRKIYKSAINFAETSVYVLRDMGGPRDSSLHHQQLHCSFIQYSDQLPSIFFFK